MPDYLGNDMRKVQDEDEKDDKPFKGMIFNDKKWICYTITCTPVYITRLISQSQNGCLLRLDH